MQRIGLIGGTGLSQLDGFEIVDQQTPATRYGSPSASLLLGHYQGRELVFLSRHGSPPRIPPHRVNYRANLLAMRELGVERIVAVAAVGGIAADCGPGRVVVPDQLIDYTYGRGHSFHEDDLKEVVHVDFTHPYTLSMREVLLDSAGRIGLDLVDGGVYGATQGPRLETAAEIDRMERDGCTLVGMTGMPEAVLARELAMDYVCCAVVANRAAGRSAGLITMADIEAALGTGMARVRALLAAALPAL